jgi:hypothetical protein
MQLPMIIPFARKMMQNGLVGLTLVFAGCASSVKPYKRMIPESRDITFSFDSPSEEIKILYVTCGMIIIQAGDHGILFDPFFSYQPFLTVPFHIRTRPSFYQAFKERFDSTLSRTAIQQAFISHTHYDHVMDLPVLLHDRYFPELKKITGNEFLPAMLHHHKESVTVMTLTDQQVFNPLIENDTAYQWLPAAPNMDVLAIASMHGPHKFGVVLMNRPVDQRYFKRKKRSDPYARSKGYKWSAGCTYSFLVRLQKQDGTDFKIFVQTSASNAPYGLPPEGEDADLVLLCFASMQEVTNYPAFIIEKTNARKLVLVHWEDFFRYPKHSNDLKVVRGTRKQVVLQRLKQLREENPGLDVVMPKPGTLIKILH